MNYDRYTQSIENAKKNFDGQITVFAEAFRTQVIRALCRRHRLRFLSGNGDYYFVRKDGKNFAKLQGVFRNKLACKSDAVEAGYPAIAEVFDVLDIEISRDTPFGYYVGSVE